MAATREIALRNLALADKGNMKGRVSKWNEIQKSIADAYMACGGTEGLIAWIYEDKSNKKDFYNHICRSIGSKIDINIGKDAQIMIVLEDLTIGKLSGTDVLDATPDKDSDTKE